MKGDNTKTGLAIYKDVLIPLAVIAVLLLLDLVLPEYYKNSLTLWIILGLLALSLDLIWGFGGIFSFGQTAFFGVGGYVYGVIAINLMTLTGETTTALLGGLLAGALLAALLGYFIFYGRISEMYLSIITLAVPLVLLTVMSSTSSPKYAVGKALLGGYNGMIGIPPVSLGIPRLFGVPLTIEGTYIFVVVLAGIVYMGVKLLLKKPFGHILAAIRENELRTELLGYDIRLIKLTAFILAGGIAGLAGALYAAWGMFINPAIFGLPQAAKTVIWVLVGGQGTIVGAFLGVFVVEGLASLLGSSLSSQTPLILGLVLILAVLFLPNGIVPVISSLARKFRTGKERTPGLPDDIIYQEKAFAGCSAGNGETALVADSSGETDGHGSILKVDDISKSFGGLKAVNNVTIDFSNRTVYSLIGPNGAGKSTLFNLLIGRYCTEGGSLFFSGEEITKLLPHERVRRGMGIKLQVSSIYNKLTVYENVWLAAYRKHRNSGDINRLIWNILKDLGLLAKAEEMAGYLSHGEQQKLEIGMVMAAEPTVVLLDEPTAGMTREETSKTVDLINKLKSNATVIVVEHDIEFVRQLQAPVIVFHQGAIFTQGNIEDLRNDEAILNIYLGGRSRVATQ